MTLVSNGHVLRSTSAGATPMAAFDVVLDKLERQVVRSKERPRSVRERHSDEVDSVVNREALGTLEADRAGEDADGRPVGGEDQALRHAADVRGGRDQPDGGAGTRILRLPNAESDQVAVLYRRRDGSYGLIEPVIGNGRSR